MSGETRPGAMAPGLAATVAAFGVTGDAAMPVGEASREIRVAVIEDDRSTRDGLKLLLGATPGFACAGAWGSVEEAFAAGARAAAGGAGAGLAAAAPEVLLLDVRLPGLSGPEAIPGLRARWPATLVLMLTSLEDENVVVEALANGAVGYVLKRTPPARLLEAIAEVAAGGSPMSPEVARRVVGLFQRAGGVPRHAAESDGAAELSPQERRLLALLADGHSYQTAAGELGISVNTVRKHIRNLYEKLQVHTRGAAVGKAMRRRLI
jgi:DNA-binding NarL/FixJ family response regulator